MFQDIAYYGNWFFENQEVHIIPYIEKNFPEESWNYQLWFMQKHLFFSKKIIENELNLNSQKQKIYLKKLVHRDNNEGKIVLVEGAMGGGKTGFGCWTLDEYYKQKPYLNYFFVTRSETHPVLPSWIKIVSSMDDVEKITVHSGKNAVALIDEGAINLNARRSMTKENVDASMLLVKLRQKGITMVILVQHTKMIDPNVRRLASVRILKHGINFHSDEEDESEDIKEIRRRLKPRSKKEVYLEILSDGIYLNFSHPLPEWWDDEKVSKYMKNWEKATPTPKKGGKSDGRLSEKIL